MRATAWRLFIDEKDTGHRQRQWKMSTRRRTDVRLRARAFSMPLTCRSSDPAVTLRHFKQFLALKSRSARRGNIVSPVPTPILGNWAALVNVRTLARKLALLAVLLYVTRWYSLAYRTDSCLFSQSVFYFTRRRSRVKCIHIILPHETQ